MKARVFPILLLCGIAGAARLTAAERFVATRELLLRVPISDEVERIYVWCSTDGRRTWQRVDFDDPCADAANASTPIIHYAAADDGRVDFYAMLVNAAGASCPPPVSGSEPIASVIVDTRAPLVQVHEVKLSGDETLLRIRASIVEENLADAGVRIFFRHDAAGPWQDGGAVRPNDGTIDWPLPAGCVDAVQCRVVVTDRAGNSSASETRLVTLRRADQPARLTADEVPRNEPMNSAEKNPAVDIADLEAMPAADAARIANLRQQAAVFSAKRQFSLAEARLEDALRIDPENIELLADLGRVLLKQKQFAAAQNRFQSVLQNAPENRAARSGIAEAFLSQNKFPAAREHLVRLLELNPDDPATLLQLGDTQHRLGESDEARRLWQRAGLVTRDDVLRQSTEARLKMLGKSK